MAGPEKEMSFWGHLDELRKVLFRMILVLVVAMFVAFAFKEPVFRIILAPCKPDFFFYSWLSKLAALINSDSVSQFSLDLINIELASQFFVHLRVSMLLAVVLTAPLLVYFIWTFVAPALYKNEKRAIKGAFSFAAVLFYLGVAVGYCVIFPLTIRFLGTYQVSSDIPNRISLTSYIGMFIGLILAMGIVFELPVLASILNRIGVLPKSVLKKYRRHALVVLMILAAIITPSGDIFTLMVVTCPLYLLYEFSILICKN